MQCRIRAKQQKKSRKQTRRLARYEIISDEETERLINAGTSLQPKFVMTIHEIFQVIESIHIATGHGGRDKIIAMHHNCANLTRKMIDCYLPLCSLCLEKKSVSLKRVIAKPILMNNYLERMQIDLIDMLTKADGQYKWILTCADHFTKWTSVRPLRSKRGIKVVHALLDVFAETGVPELLQHDCGCKFCNETL